MPRIDAGCAKSGCHDDETHAGDVRLTTVEDVTGIPGFVIPRNAAQSRLIHVITSTSASVRMPPPPWQPLDSTMIKNVITWIEEGASRTTSTYPIDTISVRYEHRIKPLIDLYCIGCHKRQVSGSGPILSTYARVVDEIRNGHFLQTIQHIPGYVPMPPGRTRVSDRDLDLIKSWVAHGLKE
ncbi:MAG: c-type cytochrome [Candidatus Kapabacteria bacterium]|nr:c-type cytochrome [Candidatus Kapabacteria bacterium]